MLTTNNSFKIHEANTDVFKGKDTNPQPVA